MSLAENEKQSSVLDAAVSEAFLRLRQTSATLRQLSPERKSKCLVSLADLLEKNGPTLMRANDEDLARLPEDTAAAFRDRLKLDDPRILAMALSLRQVAALPDPVGEIVEERTLSNGLRLRRIRAPLGVILMIFESRPNVITEAYSLALKSGNTIALRGGSESRSTAVVLYDLIGESLRQNQVDENSFYGFTNYDRSLVEALLKKQEWIDVVVPRGGDKLIDFVTRTALMPIIKNDRGLCHAYVDDEVDLKMAMKVVTNAKTQRPGVCNSLETVLVHEKRAEEFLPLLYDATVSVQLCWKVDTKTLGILKGRARVEAATAVDWDTEHLDQILNCRIVSGIEEAMEHIACHGSRHSEAILTSNESRARRFQGEVDAAVVYWNASTRFTDGFEFGLGGELGISTQKLHVRGPVGVRELTTPRWIVDGTGQVR